VGGAAEEVELERAAAAGRVGGGGGGSHGQLRRTHRRRRRDPLYFCWREKRGRASERLRRLEDDDGRGMEVDLVSCRQMGLGLICSTFSQEMREMGLNFSVAISCCLNVDFSLDRNIYAC
jgi:hypothetical protein